MQYFAYSQKAFVYKYVVMLSDTDQFKHMSFANYLKLMFLASDALFVSCLNPEFLSQKRLKFLDSRMQFKKQTTVGENMLIKVNASGIDSSRFSLLHTFVIEGTGELVGLGKQNYELVNLDNAAPSLLPDFMRSVLEPIQVDEKYLVYKY